MPGIINRSLFPLFIFYIAILGVSTIAQAEKAGPIQATFSADKVSESTYVIHGPSQTPNPQNQGFMNNPAFIIGDGGIIVIDSGSTVQVGEMVLGIIRSISDLPVVATFSSHIHGDHWLGNQAIAEAFPEAKHYAHPKLIEQADAGEGQNWVDLMNTLTEGASAGTAYIAPTLAVDDGEKITVAGKTISVFHDPLAHTDTDIVLLFEEEKVMFLGDTTMNGQLRRLDDGSFKGLIAFLDRMISIGANVFVPGHGQSGDEEVVIAFKNLVKLILDTVTEEYENGLADFEIKPIIETKITDKSQWTDLDESLGRWVSLAYLEVEADSF